MKQALVLLLFVSNVWAETPYDKFSAEHNRTESSTITWRTAVNVKAACDAENFKRGFREFQTGNKKMDGCSFWDKKDTCIVITATDTDYWTVGHEIRHCFQGKFH